MKKKLEKLALLFLIMILGLSGCGKVELHDVQGPVAKIKVEEDLAQEIEIYVFIAASLSGSMEKIAAKYQETHPNVTIHFNADSSGALQTQIEEGFACDLFFSAATAQMEALEQGNLLVPDSIVNLLGNKLCLITYKGSGTKVKSFAEIDKADNIALAEGSVPVGRYTRMLLVNMGMVKAAADPAQLSDEQLKEALGAAEINACANAAVVTEAVKQGANEIGTVYYSDAWAVMDAIEIIDEADSALLGEPICYPIALVKNRAADEAQKNAAKEFYDYLLTDETMKVFEEYMFTRYGE